MPQTITKGYKTLLAEAEAQITTLDVESVKGLLGRADVVLVDIRDPRELEREGRIPGAFHCTRGILKVPMPNRSFRKIGPLCSSVRAAGARPWQPKQPMTWD
jgi:rhodanese-related sulfurtransferase